MRFLKQTSTVRVFLECIGGEGADRMADAVVLRAHLNLQLGTVSGCGGREERFQRSADFKKGCSESVNRNNDENVYKKLEKSFSWQTNLKKWVPASLDLGMQMTVILLCACSRRDELRPLMAHDVVSSWLSGRRHRKESPF